MHDLNHHRQPQRSHNHTDPHLGLDELAVQLVGGVGQHLVDAARVAEGDEAEAAGPAGGGGLHHHHLRHVPELGEVLPHILRRGLPGQAADKHLPGVIGDLVQVDRGQGREQSCNSVKIIIRILFKVFFH